VDVVFVLLR